MTALDWLLGSDPAIRWQAMRDLTDASPAAIVAERARVPSEGIAADVLARQGDDGAWHRDDAPDWLPTLFTVQLLRATGVDPAVRMMRCRRASRAACSASISARRATACPLSRGAIAIASASDAANGAGARLSVALRLPAGFSKGVKVWGATAEDGIQGIG